ncbi:serine hydrolase [Runella sp. CRIBMP]|uniref:serine hydrolase n=1 Tax=Runella sp. CRIBMP TaxID=2683261 RepID=UPI0014126BE4|nr:serine hydrolase [Runella sp. CRIBMP]NBB22288.1 serine hydrolase [Runella sp. CRIBMP]
MKPRYSFVFLFLLTFVTFAQKKNTPPPPTDPLTGFDAFVNQMLVEWRVPGASVAIVKDGKLLYAKGYGFKDIKKNLPVTEKTLFPIASCTKSFTSAALAILADEGKLDWNKPIKEYLPDFQLQDEFATRTVAARDLVSHRTGLPRHDLTWLYANLGRQSLYQNLKYLPLSKPLYAQYQYNNLMFMTAGVLIERLSGKSWENFLREKILQPLGMNQTALTYPELFQKEDYALSYRDSNGQWTEQGFGSNVDAIGPAGSIKSNAVEMANWLIMQLNKGKFGDKQIVSAANLKENHTPQIIVSPAEATFSELGYASYGMGWSINTYRGHLRLAHNGSIEGYRSQMAFFPNDNIGVVILTNTGAVDYYFVNAVCNYFSDKWLSLPVIDWTPRLKTAQAETKAKQEKAKLDNASKRKNNTAPSHILDSYAGTFEHPAYGTFVLEPKTDGTYVGAFHGLPFTLTHYHYDIFEGTGIFDQTKFDFKIGPTGEIERVTLHLTNAGEIDFQKVIK